jgi:tyrosyl-tRNA synthetase
LNTDDRDAVKFLQWFTLLTEGEIAAIAQAHEAAPQKRDAQRELARIITRAVHGEGELARAERASAVLFGGKLADADPADILMVFDDVPSIELPATAFDGDGLSAAEAAVRAALVASKGEAARLIKQGGLYINDRRATETESRITRADMIAGHVLVLRKGQRERRVIRVVS